jgi:hypothetical protein
MSLVSASGFIGGMKEYTYRGIQQLPLVLTSTSLIFMITTGSVAHTNLALGLGILMPIYTFMLQTILGFLLKRFAPDNSASWTRSTGDTCDLVSSYSPKKLEFYVRPNASGESVPSYWLMSLAFFVGYSLTNAIDNLTTPAQPSSDENGHEKRSTQSVFVIIATVLFATLLLFVRFWYMRGCEGRGWLGILLSLGCATGAGVIGYSVYSLSKQCGARSSDLFGIMSQILPPAATTKNPIVCASE